MRLHLTLGAVLISLLVALPSSARADGFTFTKIADTVVLSECCGPVGNIAAPAINNSGEVAFVRIGEPLGNANYTGGVFLGSGGPLVAIADSSGPLDRFSLPSVSVNDASTVAFFGSLDAGGLGLFTGNGGPLTTIADTTGPFADFGLTVSLNSSGTVAFTGGREVFTGSGGGLTPIATGFFFSEQPSINDGGTVAFVAGGPGSQLYTGSGGPVTLVADFTDVSFPAINNSGAVAFQATLGTNEWGLFTSSEGSLTQIADPEQFGTFGPISINDAGLVAFWAGLGFGSHGIFVGPDPVADKVITTGDSLFGSIVEQLIFSHDGLNNSGQVAFWARSADGTSGVYRANPVPEPNTLSLLCLSLAGLGVWRQRRLSKRIEERAPC